MRILVTGGAGFVGSTLSCMLKRDRFDDEVIALDNLRRRGSELALDRLRQAGVEFHHGDVRNIEDIQEVGSFDILLECSAEPSVQAGYGGSPQYLIQTNLLGTANCLEVARRCDAAFLFLSTSRVYPVGNLRQLPLRRAGDRLEIPADSAGVGWSRRGITTEFPLGGRRSMYGATKLCSELLIEEYRTMYDLRTVIDRCGVLTGPWQMGKVDQGFFVLWLARHIYGGPLAYKGFGGEGLQVRDVLHVADLYDLIAIQLENIEQHSGSVYNVGGGPDRSLSLAELTALCQRRLSRRIEISSEAETHPADVPYYVTDNSEVEDATGWRPTRDLHNIVTEIAAWLTDNRHQLTMILT